MQEIQTYLEVLITMHYWSYDTIRYDMIRYDDNDLTGAWKLTENCQFNLAHSSLY